jgi:site-specific DNA recombinase
MKAVIYCRVSTKEQVQNLSLPTQRKVCLEYCQRQGIEADKVFVDEGESAKTALRAEFQKMLQYCRENKGRITFVIVYSLNRFSRNTHQHLVISALLASLGITLRSATEPIDNSSTGKLMETILSGFAQFDNDVKAERTKAGMKAAMERGRWPYGAPLGYLNSGGPKGQSNIIPDRERAPLIKKAFELYATGLYTRPQVLKMVHALGLRTRKGKMVTLQTFEGILRNSLYTGEMHAKFLDKPERGSYEPIIEKLLFDQVQEIISGKKNTVTPYQRNHPDFPLRQFIKCGECARPLTASWSKGRTQKYPYYRCPNANCKAVNTRKQEVEGKFITLLERLTPKAPYLELFKAIVLDRWKEIQAEAVLASRKLEHSLQELKARRDKLIEAFIYKQLIDKTVYDHQMDKLREEIALGEVEAHNAKLEAFDIEGAVNFAQYLILNAPRLWVEMSLEQKQRFQKVLFPKGLSFSEGKFGTAETCIFFNMIQESAAPNSEVVSSTGFEPVLLE